MDQITALDLHRILNGEPPHPLVLDVREPEEYAFCRIEPSQLIPLSQFVSRVGELDPDRDTVVICHHGIRSAQAAMYLTHVGFSRVFNLQGGIDAWAVLVDPAMPRY